MTLNALDAHFADAKLAASNSAECEMPEVRVGDVWEFPMGGVQCRATVKAIKHGVGGRLVVTDTGSELDEVGLQQLGVRVRKAGSCIPTQTAKMFEIDDATLSRLNLAQDVLIDLGWAYAANAWVAPVGQDQAVRPLKDICAVGTLLGLGSRWREEQHSAKSHAPVEQKSVEPVPIKFVRAASELQRLGYNYVGGAWESIDGQMSNSDPGAFDKPAIAGLATDGEYGKLGQVLNRAHAQASGGKGKERHANGLPFEEQPMASINKALGSVDGFIYQAHKKSLEAKRLPDGRAQAELLGAINYLAGAVIALDTWAKKVPT